MKADDISVARTGSSRKLGDIHCSDTKVIHNFSLDSDAELL